MLRHVKFAEQHIKRSKCFAFGFDTRIKTISLLINRLINDALVYSWPCFD